MKKYKTWEVIKMLAENPELRFKCDRYIIGSNSYGSIVHVKNGACLDAGVFVVLDASITSQTGWELIQQPIPFLEAVKAYSEGKTVYSEGTFRYVYEPNTKGDYFVDNDGDAPSVDEILKNKWYIGEPNE